MSEPTQKELVAFMQKELATREQSYPVRVEMGRMTEKESARGLTLTRAVVAILMRGESAKLIASDAVKEIRKGIADVTNDKFLKVEPTLHQIHVCASKHQEACEHCRAIAQLIEDSLGFPRL